MSGLLRPPRSFRIDRAKVTLYLLNPAHPIGGPKAKFFIARGFSRSRPEEFEQALQSHALTACLASTACNGFVDKFVFEGDLAGPNGPIPRVRSVWGRAPGAADGELITAYIV